MATMPNDDKPRRRRRRTKRHISNLGPVLCHRPRKFPLGAKQQLRIGEVTIQSSVETTISVRAPDGVKVMREAIGGKLRFDQPHSPIATESSEIVE
jgi:hypothetical protein